MSTDYEPISCVWHSHYELAILHRRLLRVTWSQGSVVFNRVVQPLDLQTRDHAEYLIGRDMEGADVRIRLDRIRSCLEARTGRPLTEIAD